MNPQLTTVGMKVKPTANTFPAVLVLFSNTATQEPPAERQRKNY